MMGDNHTVAFQVSSDEVINVLLIGAGGNGAEMFDALVRIHLALTDAFDLPGLNLIVMDDDTVAPHNLIRQRYYPHEIGSHKSVVLCHRVNMTFGTTFQGLPRRFKASDCELVQWADIVITAVDTLSARRAVYEAIKASHHKRGYWLDMGVDKAQGQVILGGKSDNSITDRLPNVIAHYPEVLTSPERHNEPSCSAAESIARQDLFVNQSAALIAGQLLWQTIRTGQINRNGGVFDLTQGQVSGISLLPPLKARVA